MDRLCYCEFLTPITRLPFNACSRADTDMCVRDSTNGRPSSHQAASMNPSSSIVRGMVREMWSWRNGSWRVLDLRGCWMRRSRRGGVTRRS